MRGPAKTIRARAAPRHPGGARIRLLGSLAVERGGETLSPRRRATGALIAYLALHPGGASRDQLLEAIWPEEDPALTRARLWQSVSEARDLLGPALQREQDRYKLDRGQVQVDAVELEELGRSREPGDLGSLERAFRLFLGDPLATVDGVWATGERRRLRAYYVDLAERVGRLRLVRGDATGALAAAEAGLRLDDLNERLWRLAMEAESTLGLRSALARRYEQLRETLAERLGLEPERPTRQLYRDLLGQV